MKEVVSTDKAPAAIGPYSQAIRAGDFLYVSGQIPVNPDSGEMPSSVPEQTRQSLENVKAILETAGCSTADVVKTTVFITDMANFGAMNGVYAEYFQREAPARACVAVKELPKGALVEIEAIAYKAGRN